MMEEDVRGVMVVEKGYNGSPDSENRLLGKTSMKKIGEDRHGVRSPKIRKELSQDVQIAGQHGGRLWSTSMNNM